VSGTRRTLFFVFGGPEALSPLVDVDRRLSRKVQPLLGDGDQQLREIPRVLATRRAYFEVGHLENPRTPNLPGGTMRARP